MARNATTRKTQLGKLANVQKAGDEFVFILREDLVQDSIELFEAEFLFDVDNTYQGREAISDATEPCVVDVRDVALMGFMGWTKQRGRARWRTVEVEEEGETRRKLIGEILSLEKIGPIFYGTVSAAMASGATVAVTTTIAGEERTDLQVKDARGYIPVGKSIKANWPIQFFWNHDLKLLQLLDCPICPTTA